ncbi:MAG TPA: hypothetical protein VEG67_02815 [Myxococcota bacterium]|nr:hypothetical protein [Myxococcota bacterium]
MEPKGKGSGGGLERIAGLLLRAERLLVAARSIEAPILEDGAALALEAERLRPELERLVGQPYGRLPRIGYRSGLEARLAGPWSQYLTLGFGPTRVVRMTSLATSRSAIPTILAHELAHRYSFDESVTTLRGLEVSARIAEAGDPLHGRSARAELARLALGAAIAEAQRGGTPEPIDAFFRLQKEQKERSLLARSAAHWERVRGRATLRTGPDCVTLLYADAPGRALEQTIAMGQAASPPIPFPRFPIDSGQAAFAAAYTAIDALLGRRRARVPLQATLRLWKEGGEE